MGTMLEKTDTKEDNTRVTEESREEKLPYSNVIKIQEDYKKLLNYLLDNEEILKQLLNEKADN